jgi:hypothetical protein
MSRFQYFLDNPLTEDGEVVSCNCRPSFTLNEDFGSHFCSRLSPLRAIVHAKRVLTKSAKRKVEILSNA